jgi:hypothetical protein
VRCLVGRGAVAKRRLHRDHFGAKPLDRPFEVCRIVLN